MVAETIEVSKECNVRVNAALDVDTLPLSDEELTRAIRKGLDKATAPTRKRDMFLEVVVNGYLSGFGTPIANGISVGLQNITAPTLEILGAMTDKLRLTKGNREFADGIAMFEAMLEGFSADVMFFRKGWDNGYPLDITQSTTALARQLKVAPQEAKKIIGREIAGAKAKVQFADPNNTSTMEDLVKAYEKQGFTPEEFQAYMDESYDYIRSSIPAQYGGNIIRWPTRLTVAIDEYGKARFRRQKIAQMASVKARKDAEAGKGNYRTLYNQYRKDALKVVDEAKGEEIEEVFGRLKADTGRIFGQGEDSMLPYKDIKDFALRQTFQSALVGWPKLAQEIKRESVLVSYFVPFIKTPWNILKEGTTFVPGLGVALRPKYLQGSTPVKMSNEELIPRQVLGAAMFTGVAALYANNNVTGSPRNAQEAQAWKDQGIQPYSIKIGDTWVSYQRIEPIATVLGLASDLLRTHDDYQENPSPETLEKTTESIGQILGAMKSNMFSKSFMEGFANITEVVSDPERYMQSFAATGLRPLSPAFLNMIARSTDEYERLAATPLEKLQQRFPFLREQLPVEYGAIGDARKTDTVQALTGFGVTSAPQSPLQFELARLKFTKGRVGNEIMRVGLTTQQLGEYRQMSAEMLTPILENFINSATYQNAKDPRKKWLLEKVTGRVQGQVRKQYFAKLRRTDPDVARKFFNEYILSQGLEQNIPLRTQ